MTKKNPRSARISPEFDDFLEQEAKEFKTSKIKITELIAKNRKQIKKIMKDFDDEEKGFIY